MARIQCRACDYDGEGTVDGAPKCPRCGSNDCRAAIAVADLSDDWWEHLAASDIPREHQWDSRIIDMPPLGEPLPPEMARRDAIVQAALDAGVEISWPVWGRLMLYVVGAMEADDEIRALLAPYGEA